MTHSDAYVVSQQIAAPRTIAAVHARVPIGAVGRTLRRYLDQVYGHWTDDEARLQTDVFYLLEPATRQHG